MPTDIPNAQTLRAFCDIHSLDYESLRTALLDGSTVARVALTGEMGGWPAAHVAAARAEFSADPR